MKDHDVIDTWVQSPDGRASFFSQVRRDGEHLVWTGYVRNAPCWVVGGRMLSARRVMLSLSGSPIPDGMMAVLTCENERCLTHLTVAKSQCAARTHCANGHELTEDNLTPSVTDHRRCLTCHRQRSREAMARYRSRRKAAKTEAPSAEK